MPDFITLNVLAGKVAECLILKTCAGKASINEQALHNRFEDYWEPPDLHF
jgi:hypothetical protein